MPTANLYIHPKAQVETFLSFLNESFFRYNDDDVEFYVIKSLNNNKQVLILFRHRQRLKLTWKTWNLKSHLWLLLWFCKRLMQMSIWLSSVQIAFTKVIVFNHEKGFSHLSFSFIFTFSLLFFFAPFVCLINTLSRISLLILPLPFQAFQPLWLYVLIPGKCLNVTNSSRFLWIIRLFSFNPTAFFTYDVRPISNLRASKRTILSSVEKKLFILMTTRTRFFSLHWHFI